MRSYISSHVRRFLLPLFERHNPGDVTIRNPHTRDRVRLHSFRHKGYWFHGRRREASSMALFSRLVRPGDVVAEVGGHIGYISQFFARLVGHDGQVIVFEPGPNNLPYLLRNTGHLDNVTVVPKGVGESAGRATFFVENLTGQNNSFVPDFEALEVNADAAGITPEVQQIDVAVTTLDIHFPEPPDFIKVDVEGFELEVLRGARRTLAIGLPALMVEVQAHQDELRALADELGYVVIDAQGTALDLTDVWSGNSFWLHPQRHAAVLAEVRASHT